MIFCAEVQCAIESFLTYKNGGPRGPLLFFVGGPGGPLGRRATNTDFCKKSKTQSKYTLPGPPPSEGPPRAPYEKKEGPPGPPIFILIYRGGPGAPDIKIGFLWGPRGPMGGPRGPPFPEKKKNSRLKREFFFSNRGPRAPRKIRGPGPHYYSGGPGGLCPPGKKKI